LAPVAPVLEPGGYTGGIAKTRVVLVRYSAAHRSPAMAGTRPWRSGPSGTSSRQRALRPPGGRCSSSSSKSNPQQVW